MSVLLPFDDSSGLCFMEIPKAYRQRFGKPRFVQSLETESRSVAERRVLPVVSRWKKDIATAKGEPVEEDAAYFRRRLRNAKSDSERESILERIDHEADEIGYSLADIGVAPSKVPEAVDFFNRATGNFTPFTELLDEWLSTSRATLRTIWPKL